MIRFLTVFVVAAAVLAVVGSSPESADAATFVVDRFDDPTPNTPRCTPTPNDCSLREAVLAANATPVSDNMTLRAGAYNITRTGAGAGGGDLDITGPLTINGAISPTIIDANDIDRVFDIACAASCYVEFNRLQIRDGLLNAGEGGGAGIRTSVNASLSLNNSLVTSNKVLSSAQATFGAGILSAGNLGVGKSTVSFNVGEGAAAFGGGIYQNGSEFNVVESTIGNNSAWAGGGVYVTGGSAFIERSAIVANTATGSLGGGGVYSGNPLTLRNSTLSGNNAGGLNADGGGLLSRGGGPITIENATIKGNSAAGLGDGIYHDSDLIGSLSYKHTIFDNIVNLAADENCSAYYSTTLQSLGKNIFTDDSCRRTAPATSPISATRSSVP